MDAPAKTAAPPRRPRLRFTLRLLLVGLTLLCLGLGWWTHRAREQRRVVERIEASWRGKVDYRYQRAKLSRAGHPIGESCIPSLLLNTLGRDFFHNVDHAYLTSKEVVQDLDRLHGLRVLILECEGLTDEDIEAIGDLHRLEVLVVFANEQMSDLRWPHSAKIGDRSLEVISQLPKIEDVHLTGRGFTPEGLKTLASTKRLRHVYLQYCDESVNARAIEPFKISGTIESLKVIRWVQSNEEEQTVAEW